MFFSITRGMNFSITRGENFILAHPLGEELYSCDVLLIDQNIGKIIRTKKEKIVKLITTRGTNKIRTPGDHHETYEFHSYPW